MGAKILVVDDEPDVEALVTRQFRKAIRKGEFEFLFARDGEEALSTICEHAPGDPVNTAARLEGANKHFALGCVSATMSRH